MIHCLSVGMVVLGLTTAALAQSSQQIGHSKGTAPNGMVITGEREGPVGLHVAPWQDPVETEPEVFLQARLPLVLDHSRSVAEDAINRSFPAIDVAKSPADKDKKDLRTNRRGKPKDDAQTPALRRSIAQ